MKKLLGIAVAVAVLAGVAAVYAGDAGCCAAGKAKSASAGCSSACSKMLSKLNLTSDQQTRIAALNQQLRTATSKSERIAMFAEGMERILTPEQFAQWKSVSDMMARNGVCPLMTTQTDSGKAG
jgi:Spy/CpxP family protein refolding chaperone